VKPFLLFLALHFFKSPCLLAQQAEPVAKDTHSTLMIVPEQAVSFEENPHPFSKSKTYAVAGVHAASYTGTLLILSKAWYKDFPKAPFHTFNDSREWLQVDKAGHAWTAYTLARYSAGLWIWAGIAREKAAWLGGISGLGYQTILESLDAHSAQWGWSWADMGANIAGASLFTAQQLLRQEQSLQLKFSAFPERYAAPEMKQRAAALFGNHFPERLLKDYNAQTYWLSVNIRSILHNEVPGWLNIAVGYGAKGMYGGFENIAIDGNGIVLFDRRDIKRQRQWYLSPDIDWTKINTKKQAVKTLFSVLNMIKVPAPALELRNGKLQGRLISF
jgi:hypothetical protein